MINPNDSLIALRHMSKNAFTTANHAIDLELMAEEFQMLDDHLVNGGFLPIAWHTSFIGRIRWILFGNREKL